MLVSLSEHKPLNLHYPPTQTPDASQWNIGGVGSSGVGYVYFMYISCSLCIIFCFGYARISRRKPSFQWNMGLSFASAMSLGFELSGSESISPEAYFTFRLCRH